MIELTNASAEKHLIRSLLTLCNSAHARRRSKVIKLAYESTEKNLIMTFLTLCSSVRAGRNEFISPLKKIPASFIGIAVC